LLSQSINQSVDLFAEYRHGLICYFYAEAHAHGLLIAGLNKTSHN